MYNCVLILDASPERGAHRKRVPEKSRQRKESTDEDTDTIKKERDVKGDRKADKHRKGEHLKYFKIALLLNKSK